MLTVLNVGNVYIADNSNYRVRKITVATGIIKTFAGKGLSSPSYSGDSGQATSAALNIPYSVALDTSGMIIFLQNYSLFALFSFCI